MTQEKLNKFSNEIQEMFSGLKKIIYGVAPSAQEKLWAGLPSYYAGEAFVRIIPFKDHINIEASALPDYKAQLQGYKFTPKNMLQIFVGQTVPAQILKDVFRKTLIA